MNANKRSMQIYSTYVIQSILATLFICIYGFQDLTRTKRRKTPFTDQNPTMSASQRPLDSSLKILWTSFVYFGSAVNVAAFIFALIAEPGSGLYYTFFIWCSAVGLSTHAILSVTMYRTQLSFSDRWYLGVCLLFAVITPLVFLEREYIFDGDFELLCINFETIYEVWLCQAASGGWMMLWALARWRGLAKFSPKSKAHESNLIRFSSLVFRTCHAVLNLASMWFFLRVFIRVRQIINQFAGRSFSDNE